MRPTRIRDIIMKKTILTLIVCFVCGITYAQEVTSIFATDAYEAGGYLEAPQIQFVTINRCEKEHVIIDMYKAEDFSLVQQINFKIKEERECGIPYVYFIGDYLYVRVYPVDSKSDCDGIAKLYDYQGNVIYDFGDAFLEEFLVEQIPFAKVAPNKIMFYVQRCSEDIYEFYYLTSSIDNGTQNVQVEKKAAFPCPARGEVNIPTRGQQGDLRVLNLNGQVLDAQRIQEGDYQRVNTESYPAGTYIYQAGNETGKFMVE